LEERLTKGQVFLKMINVSNTLFSTFSLTLVHLLGDIHMGATILCETHF